MTSDFTIALHILGFLTSRGGGPLTSEEIARTYGTNPVVIRRVVQKLKRAGLVESRRGVGGGTVLARPAAEINLREAYEAVSPAPQMLPRHPTSCRELVPVVLGQFVNEVCADAEEALLQRLGQVTVESMDKTIRSRIGAEMRQAASSRKGEKR